jgi:hypothetical protein
MDMRLMFFSLSYRLHRSQLQIFFNYHGKVKNGSRDKTFQEVISTTSSRMTVEIPIGQKESLASS